MNSIVIESEKRNIPWIKFKVNVPYQEIFKEFSSVWHRSVPHRPHQSTGWYSLTLHGYKAEWTEAINQYPGFEHIQDVDGPYKWTEIAHLCPKTTSFIKSLPYKKFYRVRFMLLAPGGKIDCHQDNQHSHLKALNISIRNPIGSEFRFYDPKTKNLISTAPFTDGSAFLVNIGLPHEFVNNSNQWRLHIILHGVGTDDYYQFPEKYLETNDTTNL